MYLPSLSHWENDNMFSGSLGAASWHASVRKTEEGSRELFAEVWRWPPCYELAEPERTGRFPLSQEGLDGMRDWLERVLSEVNS